MFVFEENYKNEEEDCVEYFFFTDTAIDSILYDDEKHANLIDNDGEHIVGHEIKVIVYNNHDVVFSVGATIDTSDGYEDREWEDVEVDNFRNNLEILSAIIGLIGCKQ